MHTCNIPVTPITTSSNSRATGRVRGSTTSTSKSSPGQPSQSCYAEERVGHRFLPHLRKPYSTPPVTASSTGSYNIESINCERRGRGSVCEHLQCPQPQPPQLSHPQVLWWGPRPAFGAAGARRRGTTQPQDGKKQHFHNNFNSHTRIFGTLDFCRGKEPSELFHFRNIKAS